MRDKACSLPRLLRADTAGDNISKMIVEYGAAIALALLILFNAFFTKNFWHMSTFLLVIKQATSLMFITVGMTIVISSGGTDISAGSMMAFSGVIIMLALRYGLPLWAATLAGVVCCCLVGMFNGVLIAKAGIQPIIHTLVMQIVLRGFTVMLANSKVVSMAKYPEIRYLGLTRFGGIVPIQLLFFVLVAITGYIVLKISVFGKLVEAVGGNKRAARLCGVRTQYVIIAVYALSGFLAALGGLMEMSKSGALDPNLLGYQFELDAIASVAVGGTAMKGGKAHILGSIFGCIIMTLITTMVNMNNIPFAYSNIIKSIIIIVSLAVQKEQAV